MPSLFPCGGYFAGDILAVKIEDLYEKKTNQVKVAWTYVLPD